MYAPNEPCAKYNYKSRTTLLLFPYWQTTMTITRLLNIFIKLGTGCLTCSNGITTRLSTRNVWTASHNQLICPAFPWSVISQLSTGKQITLYVIGLFYCHSFVSQVQEKHASSRRWSFCFKNVSRPFPPSPFSSIILLTIGGLFRSPPSLS